MRRFVPTPVRVETSTSVPPAFLLLDADGAEILRMPLVPQVDASDLHNLVGFACAHDLARQFNEFGEQIERALAQLGPISGARAGLEVTPTTTHLRDWMLAISVRDSTGQEYLRVTQAIDPASYARDATNAQNLVRITRQLLRRPTRSRSI